MTKIRWMRLAACIAVTTILSLSIHVIMLDGLGIPHPDNSTIPAAASWLNEALSVTATLAFYRIAQAELARLSLIARCLLLTAIAAMLGEALLRNFIMDVVVSHDWIYCFVENLPRPIEYLIVYSLIVLAAPHLKSPWRTAAAGIAIAAIAGE